MKNDSQKLLLSGGKFIAYNKYVGKKNHFGIVFLGGFMSDKTGVKATSLEKFCKQHDYSYVRFDYLGHGESSEEFTDCTISTWKQNVIDVLDNLTEGKQILVGSSMGGWLMLLAAIERQERIAGLVGIASAPDFTEDLIWQQMTNRARKGLQEHGIYNVTSEFSSHPYPVTLELIEDGRRNLLLRDEKLLQINPNIPIRLIHGLKDTDVPAASSLRVAEILAGRDIEVELVENGDHRMSTPENIKLLEEKVAEVISLLA